jgi:hypothetical protein
VGGRKCRFIFVPEYEVIKSANGNAALLRGAEVNFVNVEVENAETVSVVVRWR